MTDDERTPAPHQPNNEAGSSGDLTTVSADGVTISFLDFGGNGDPILFAHATGFCSTVWRPVIERLTDFGRCWALDARGHGHSPAPTSHDFDWSGTAADILAVIDHIEATSPDGSDQSTFRRWRGVGHSMGGAALLLAEQRRPGTFSDLWLYEPIVFPPAVLAMQPDSDAGNPLAAAAARRRPGFDSFEAARDNYSSKLPMSSFDPAALDGYLERGLATQPDGTVRLTCEPANESKMYLMGGRHRAWDGLANVACRTTVVRGSAETPGPASFAPLIAEALPSGRLEDHPDLAHFGPMEAPSLIAASIRSAFTQR